MPPNATALERALESATARIGRIDTPIARLWDPATCPVAILPWLAWSLSIDSWDPTWSEATKRDAIARSIDLHRHKGTRYSLDYVLQRHDALLQIVEWFEAGGTGTPHTFRVLLPLVTAPGVAPGGARSTAAFAERVLADILRTKPLREHAELAQSLTLEAGIGVQGIVRLLGYRRDEADLVSDTSPLWADYLQTEDGEPFVDSNGRYIETTA